MLTRQRKKSLDLSPFHSSGWLLLFFFRQYKDLKPVPSPTSDCSSKNCKTGAGAFLSNEALGNTSPWEAVSHTFRISTSAWIGNHKTLFLQAWCTTPTREHPYSSQSLTSLFLTLLLLLFSSPSSSVWWANTFQRARLEDNTSLSHKIHVTGLEKTVLCEIQ